MSEAAQVPPIPVPPVSAPVSVATPVSAPTSEATFTEAFPSAQNTLAFGAAAQNAGATAPNTGATLTEEAAVAIFVAKHTHTTRDSLSCKLATQYKITSKSVRDIWNLRTWGWATLPHWTPADKRHFLNSRLCQACRRRGVDSIEAACERCTVTKRRGRPPGIKETKPRNRTGLSRSNASLDDDSAASTFHIPVPFNAQLLLQQQMTQQMSGRGGGTQQFAMYPFSPQGTQAQNGQQASGNISLFLPHYTMPPGQEGVAFGVMQGTDHLGNAIVTGPSIPQGQQFGVYPFSAQGMMAMQPAAEGAAAASIPSHCDTGVSMGSNGDAGAGGISVTVTTPNCDAEAMHPNGEAGAGTAASVNGLDKIKIEGGADAQQQQQPAPAGLLLQASPRQVDNGVPTPAAAAEVGGSCSYTDASP